jgi:hypothetical protein
MFTYGIETPRRAQPKAEDACPKIDDTDRWTAHRRRFLLPALDELVGAECAQSLAPVSGIMCAALGKMRKHAEDCIDMH